MPSYFNSICIYWEVTVHVFLVSIWRSEVLSAFKELTLRKGERTEQQQFLYSPPFITRVLYKDRMGKRPGMSRCASTEQSSLTEDKAWVSTAKAWGLTVFPNRCGRAAETPCKDRDMQSLHARESSVFLGNSRGLVGWNTEQPCNWPSTSGSAWYWTGQVQNYPGKPWYRVTVNFGPNDGK